MRKIFALPLRLVTPMFALCLMAAPLAAQQITETFSHNANSFQMQFVKIGDAGNSGKNAGLSRPIGDVNYEYWMGKFEVDAWQIAVGNASGIVGVSVADWNHRGYTFGTNPPATGISWQEAARFVNWMNISKGYSPAYKFASYGPFNSYDPTYTGLNDMMMLWDPNDVGYNPNNPFRNSRARYFLPSLDEWFKAAFYDPTLNSGNGGYWDFPTTSNTAPTPVPGGAVGAVYDSQTGPANVDDAGSLSWYATMAQGGNVYELAETAFDLNNNDINKNRAVVGGNWGSPATQISSDFMFSSTPSAPNDSYGIGFRVAMVVEPPESDLDQDGVNYYRELKDGTNPNDPSSFNPLSKGLVAYYPFDGNANDDSGYGRNGIVYNASLTSDRVSAPLSAYSFVSASDKIEIPSLPNLSSNSFTISAWVYRTNSETFAAIFDQGLSSEPNSRIQLQFRPSSPTPWPSNSLAFCFWENDLHSDSNSALLFQWEHWLASFDRSTGLRTIYKDGLKVADDISETTQTDTGGTIGTFNDAAWPFLGSIDDVRFYARSLSADEVRQLFYSEAFSDTQKQFLVLSPSVMGHYSQAQYNANRTNGQTDVTTSPSAFNLFTRQQFDSNRTAGQSDVISNPMSYGLYDNNSIMDLHMGGLMIQKNGNSAVVSFQPQTTTDLTQPFTNNGAPITHEVPMPGNKGFLRINAKPEHLVP